MNQERPLKKYSIKEIFLFIILSILLVWLVSWVFEKINPDIQEQQEANEFVLPTVDVIRQGMNCTSDTTSGLMMCNYKVGNDLEYSIWGMGHPDASIIVDKTEGEDSEYDVRFVPNRMCITITAGQKTFQKVQEQYPDDPQARLEFSINGQYGFVSPANGMVYPEYVECEKVTKDVFEFRKDFQ